MRKKTYLVMALALVLGLTQCKKEQLDDLNDENEWVPITLTVGDGDNSRVIVDPTGAEGYATVAFEDGDEILVGYNNAYVGFLTYSNEAFSGNVNISGIVAGEHLHFYFLGGKGFDATVIGKKATVVISDQTARYPVISYAPSTREFDGAGSYSAKLMNKCSIMKFNVSTPSPAPMCITGMKNKVTVDFAKSNNNHDNGFSYGQDGNGVISMKGKATDNTIWAIVLPQGALAEGAEGSAYSMGYKGNRPAMDAIGSNQYIDANVTLTMSTFDVNYMPLTFEAKENNATVTFVSRSGVTPIDMEYNKNGEGWVKYTSGISLNQGDKVSFRGNNSSLAASSENTSKFTCSKPCYIYGNIMSLLDKIAYPTATALGTANTFRKLFKDNTNIYKHENYPLILPATIMAQECYSYMFAGCTSLTSAPVLPATTLATRCYGNMFEGCTGLITAPALPASTLSTSCYQCMFQGCTSLSSAPELSATSLALNCYSFMFSGCTNLTSAPALPAETLQECCYESMFSGCNGLQTAPTLLASTLVKYCYQNMFKNCSNLNSVTCLATNISATDCIAGWLDDVASSGTLYKAASMTGWEVGVNFPAGWTLVNAN